jgi:hypothetical protein
MTTTLSSLSGQPDVVPAGVLRLRLQRQTVALAQQFADSKVHLPVTKIVQDALSERLSTAGFQPQTDGKFMARPRSDDATFLKQRGLYVVKSHSEWLHPDCSVAFAADVTLYGRVTSSQAASVMAVVRLEDVNIPKLARGVLHGREFVERLRLASEHQFDSAQAWGDWVDSAIKRFTLAEAEGMLDRAMAHLERATAP